MNSLHDLAVWLQDSAPAVAIAESDWMFQALETLHVLALTLVVGTIAMVDLRLLGLFARDRLVSDMSKQALPWTWVAFGAALLSGALLFVSKAVAYYGNWPFRIKMLLLALAGLNMLYFHFNAYRGVAGWDRGTAPASARVAGILSLLFWVSVVTLGRWIGFTTK